jgi:hypothetical protein
MDSVFVAGSRASVVDKVSYSYLVNQEAKDVYSIDHFSPPISRRDTSSV